MRVFVITAVVAVLSAPAEMREDAAFLAVHNEARAAVGVPPLVWSDKLATYAQDWANRLARSGKFEHRPDNPYGENLAAYSERRGPEYGAQVWLSEKKDYHGEIIDSRNYHRFGHYTQLVWRTTTHVGYGIARSSNGMWILVANYSPAGNVQGEFPYKR